MITTTIILASALTGEPNADPPRSTPPPDTAPLTVTTQTMAGLAAITATDRGGQVVTEIVVWSGRAGQTYIDALFADGGYLSITVDGDHVLLDSDDPSAAAQQVATVFDALAQQEPQDSRTALPCIGSIALGIGAVWTANLPGAIGAVIFIACNCIHLINPEADEC